MTFTNDCPCGRSQIFTALEEMALANSHLLPETKKVVYFVTAMQGESKKIIYIGFTSNLRRKFKDHKRKMEFEFLDRMGYQIHISWIVLPEGTRDKQAQVTQAYYVRVFEPKLNIHQNTFAAVQVEQLKKGIENLEQCKYDFLKKQVENWEQSGDDKDTIIKKIWEAGRDRLMVNI
jgi:predicted GIY-YIG superfamily endonuclease